MFREGFPGRTDRVNGAEQKYLSEMAELEEAGAAIIMFHAGKGYRYILTEKNGVKIAKERRGYVETVKETQTIETPVIAPDNEAAQQALAKSQEKPKRRGRYNTKAGETRAQKQARKLVDAVDAAEKGG